MRRGVGLLVALLGLGMLLDGGQGTWASNSRGAGILLVLVLAGSGMLLGGFAGC